MKLTKYSHACVRLEEDGRVLTLDPGTFSEVETALQGAQAVLITHEHGDHIDAPRVLEALRADTGLELYAPAGVAESLRAQLEDDGGARARVHEAVPGTVFEAAGFRVRTFGGQHALIHPNIDVVKNIGYLIEESVYHPGDSFVVPHGLQAQVLLLPIHAPWSKTSEVIDFVISVRAPRVFQIHDGLLNQTGLAATEGHVQRQGAPFGSVFEHLEPGESREL